MIHITDSQTDRILDVIDEEEFWDDKHYKSLKDTLETFDFVTFADKRFSEHLAKRNRIIIPDEDGKYIEFVIENTREYRDSSGGLYIEVYTSATYIELTKSKIIKPQTTSAWSAKQHAEWALAGTEWEVGDVDFSGSRTLIIEEHTNPYAYLKRLATEFDLELHFRVEIDGTKVVRRYVDLIKRVGVWQGREVEFGKDLIGIERKEDFSNIVTALIGLGPEREDGTRLEVFVEDKDALARWGRNGQHLVEVYEPQSTDQTMTEARLRELTKNELEKRVNSVVEYTADISDLEKVPGLEHEKIRFGDTLRIKDTQFNPPLYLEARVHTQERSIKKNGYKTVTLGDYIEYTEEEVMAIWKSLKAEIAKKVSLTEVKEVVYTKQEVDEKDATVYQDSTQYADNVSETKKQEAIQVAAVDATEKANQAKQEAVEQAESIAEQKKQLAIQAAIADADAKLSAAKTELEADIALKADAQWVNGQLVLKADNSTVQDLQNEVSNKADVTWVNNQLVLKENAIHRGTTAPTDTTKLWLDTSVVPNVLKRYDSATSSWVKATPTSAGEVGAYTKTEVDNALNSKVSVTTYTADKNGIISRLDSAESRITQNEQEIATKVSQTDYDALEGRVSQAESSIVQNANAIQSKVSQTDFNELEGRVSTAESTITQQANLIEQKVNRTDYDTDMNGVVTRLDSAESRITQTENEIATKVSRTEFEALQIGGRNLIRNSDFSDANKHWGGNFTRVVKDGKNAIEMVGNDSTNLMGLGENEYFLLEPNTTYTYQVEIMVDTQIEVSNSKPLHYHIRADGSNTGGREWIVLKSPSVLTPNKWHKIILQFKTKDITSPITFRPYIYQMPAGVKFWITYFKLEEGNKPTDWSPAPEDTQAQIDGLGTRVSSAETSITQLSNQIQLKANKTDVYTKTEVNNQLANKADNTTVNALETRISEAEAQLTIQANEIATKVSQTTFTQELSKKENAVTKSNSAPSNPTTNMLWLDTSVTPNVLKRWSGSAWVKATPTTASEVGAYTKSETDTKLGTKANQSDLNTLTTRVSSAETSITQLSDQIQLKANQSTVDTLANRISSAESSITLLSDEIDLKVNKDGVISAINVSSEGVRIDGAKVHITGQTTIDNGVIKTAHIESLTFDKLRGGTATLGGSGNNGSLEVLGADNSVIFRASRDGLIGSGGQPIITKNGLISSFTFLSSGDVNGWQRCGWWDYGGVGQYEQAYIRFRIPVNFTVTNAAIYVYSMPIYISGHPVITTGYYHTRYIKLFKINNITNQFFDMPFTSDNYGIVVRSGSATDISSTVWGKSRWDPQVEGTVSRIQVIGGGITSLVDPGYNEFFVKSDSAIQDQRNSSLIQIMVIIEGYQSR